MKIIKLSIVTLITMFFSSCYYDNLGELKPESALSVGSCDTSSAISFSVKIKPIIDANCISCHGTGGSLPDLSTHAGISGSATLYNSIIWDGSVSNMPKGSTVKLSACDIATIRLWKAQGAPNN
jgi:hypothetical protein